jgi:phage gp36-like protein
VNDLVEEWALCIAEYELYKRGPGGNVPDKIRKSYEDTLVLLADLSSGKISIPSATAVPSNSNGSSISVKSSTALFDETSMEGF